MKYPTRDEIRDLCTEQSFERGLNYWRQDRIQELTVDGQEIRATVRGSREYNVSVDIADDTVRTHCNCPYDHAGDCKHIVAVLLAVDDREATASSDADPVEDTSVDTEALVEQTSADEVRTFLLDLIEGDRDIRDQFVAFAGEETGKTVFDYKKEIDRLFENAADRRGMIEYDTRIDFSQYHELADQHREQGHVDAATDIYRALAEAIRENMDRIDDSGGYYGRELERAVESYAETVVEHKLDHERKQPHIEYLFEEFVTAEYDFVSENYADALRTLCTTRADLEYWLNLLDTRVSTLNLDVARLRESTGSRTGNEREQGTAERAEAGNEAQSNDEHARADDTLYASDFTEGRLTTDDFTGGALDIEHLAVGPLDIEFFVGDAFDELHIDDQTTVEAHTVEPDKTTSPGPEISSTLRTRALVSMYRYLFEELGEDDALTALYEETYLESRRFCRQYAERLSDEGDDGRAIAVLEDGIDTFGSTTALRWLAADLYRDRNPERYRETLKRLFLDHSEWDAYDELKGACDDEEWQSLYEEFERALGEGNPQQLIDMYVHEMNLEKAFAELKQRESLSWFRRYRDPVATVDSVEYFELYRELLVPFAASETGRRHYREIADHLDEMQELVSEERFEEFIDFLKNKHSNRPAFLDELNEAGF